MLIEQSRHGLREPMPRGVFVPFSDAQDLLGYTSMGFPPGTLSTLSMGVDHRDDVTRLSVVMYFSPPEAPHIKASEWQPIDVASTIGPRYRQMLETGSFGAIFNDDGSVHLGTGTGPEVAAVIYTKLVRRLGYSLEEGTEQVPPSIFTTHTPEGRRISFAIPRQTANPDSPFSSPQPATISA